MPWRLKSAASLLFTEAFIKAQIKENDQCSASLAFVRRIHRWPVNSPHEEPVTRKMFPFNDVIMDLYLTQCNRKLTPQYLNVAMQSMWSRWFTKYYEIFYNHISELNSIYENNWVSISKRNFFQSYMSVVITNPCLERRINKTIDKVSAWMHIYIQQKFVTLYLYRYFVLNIYLLNYLKKHTHISVFL